MFVPNFTSMFGMTSGPADTCKPPVKPLVPRRQRYFTFNSSDANKVAATAPSSTIEGRAHICFCQDGSWFEGHLTTSDLSSYALHGKRQLGWSTPPTATPEIVNGRTSIPIPSANGHRESSSSSDDSPPIYMVVPNGRPSSGYAADPPGPEDSGSGYYDVTVVDHDDEQEYPFRAVRLITRSHSLWTLASPHLSFAAERTHRGQKADMLIQKYLTPRLVGNSLKVSVGRLSMDLEAATLSSTSNNFNGPMPRRTSSDSRLWCL